MKWDYKNIFQWNKRVNDMEIESKKTFLKGVIEEKEKHNFFKILLITKS